VKVLDRFAIDYALCMYCGICVEVCPFDALFWAPDFEYAEYDIVEMTHEKQRLEEWTYKVLPPPPLEEGAEPMPTPEEPPIQTGGGEAVASRPPSAAETPAPGAQPPAEMAPPRAEPETPTPPPRPAAAAEATAPEATAEAPAQAAPAQAAPAQEAAPARPAGERHEVEPDQETVDRVLAEELAKGTDRRVADGRARAAGIRAARKKAGG
jgi:NADH-quinone oxidoreductase subunit I